MHVESNDIAYSNLDGFLASVEKDAYRLALAACRDPDEAVDLVQDSMLVMVQKYRHKPANEWKPLFHRVLQNRIRDWFRRRTVKHSLLRWSGLGDTTEIVEQQEAPQKDNPDSLLVRDDALHLIEAALVKLPYRQQQTFLLRAWKEMSIEETAAAMSISTSSVKTHYSRAIDALQRLLESAEGVSE